MVTWVPGHKALHRFGEHMRGIVADEFERARIVAGEKLDFGIVRDRVGQVGKLAIERHGDRALGERRRNAFGDVEAGGVLRVVPTRAIGKGQRDHHSLLLLTRCLRMQVSVVVFPDARLALAPCRVRSGKVVLSMIWSENRYPPSDQVRGQAFRDYAPGGVDGEELVPRHRP